MQGSLVVCHSAGVLSSRCQNAALISFVSFYFLMRGGQFSRVWGSEGEYHQLWYFSDPLSVAL